MLYVYLSVCIGFFALPPQGSHPVPQPVVETGARHLQEGRALRVLRKSMFCRVLFFFFRLPWLPSWNFQDPNITELCSLWQDCEVIGWAELCERKKLTAGCFQLQWLGHRESEECDACVLVVGWIRLEKIGPKQRCQLRSFPILPKLVGYCNFMTFSKDLRDVKYFSQ